jgi:integrase
MTKSRRGSGEGSVYKRVRHRRGKNYELWCANVSLGFDENGKRIRVEVCRTKKADVLTELAKLKANPRAKIEKPEGVTITSHGATWLAEVVDPGLARTTANSYREKLDLHITPRIGHLKVHEIEPAHVQRFIGQMNREGVGARTIYLCIVVLSGILKNAVKLGLARMNVAAGADLPRVRKKDPGFHNAEQMAHVLAIANENAARRQAAYYELAYDSGARPGELRGAQWNDLDLRDVTKARWKVRHMLTEVKGVLDLQDYTKSDRGIRVVDISVRTAEALKAHRKTMSDNGRDVTAGYVFVNVSGGPLRQSNFLRDVHNPLMALAAVDRITPHGTRHTCATLLLAAKVAPHVVAQRLGEDVQVLMKTYAHLLPGQQREAADALASTLAEVQPQVQPSERKTAEANGRDGARRRRKGQ